MVKAVSLRTSKFLTNRLLNRKQMVLDVFHPERPNVSKAEITQLLVKEFNVQDEKTVVVFGFRTHFGGGRSTGFALIYDTIEDMYETEPKYRLVRAGLAQGKTGTRKQRRELKNKKKKVFGIKKATVGGGGK